MDKILSLVKGKGKEEDYGNRNYYLPGEYDKRSKIEKDIDKEQEWRKLNKEKSGEIKAGKKEGARTCDEQDRAEREAYKKAKTEAKQRAKEQAEMERTAKKGKNRKWSWFH